MEQEGLKLNEFKALYKTWRRGVPWIDHLILGLLVYLETLLINNRVKVEVDQAIEDYQKIEPPMPDYVTPIYTEKLSDTSIARSEQATSLPEMRLTAPWYVESSDNK